MDKPNPWRVGSALALTAAILSLVCAVAVYLFPDGTVEFVNSWTHGLDLAVLSSGATSHGPWAGLPTACSASA